MWWQELLAYHPVGNAMFHTMIAPRAVTLSTDISGCRSTTKIAGHGAMTIILMTLTPEERQACLDGKGIHVPVIPGTFGQNKTKTTTI